MRTIIVVIIVAFIAVLTNPGAATHKEEVKNKVHQLLETKIEKDKGNGIEKAAKSVGLFLGKTISNEIVDNAITTENYGLFSTSYYKENGEKKVVAIGAFGNVFFTSHLEQVINEEL